MRVIAEAIVAHFERIATMSHKAIRRLFGTRNILYRQAKHWLTSLNPLYGLHKRQRDRLVILARAAADGAAVWLDEAWFVRWPYRFWAGASARHHRRWPYGNESVEKMALFAALMTRHKRPSCVGPMVSPTVNG